MAQHAGYSRWCYNWGLSLWNASYKDGYKPNARKLREVFTNHTKPLIPWMKKLSSRVYQYAFPTECCANINLGEAFKRFFSCGMLRKQGLGKYPRFKKKGKHDSFPSECYANTIENQWKTNRTKRMESQITIYWYCEPIEATTKKITISRQAGDWYLSCSYEFHPTTTPKKTDLVGVDLGVKTLATLSDGKVFESVRAYQKFEAKLSREQYLNRHKEVGSANGRAAQLKIARLLRKVANIRKDALHKLTTYLAKNHNPPPSPTGRGARGVGEDLNVRGMLSNHKLAKIS
ncbi:transposase [Okeania sp. SIO2B3]|uniref:RNA-guided endonuclease InsQ/TnpB family protein n=1 Tax=Okeania sp. SIO2B3 TaxID=2607784 RepID=UPI0025E33125|nr:transposase [Okeania sp. SIO2B3]